MNLKRTEIICWCICVGMVYISGYDMGVGHLPCYFCLISACKGEK